MNRLFAAARHPGRLHRMACVGLLLAGLCLGGVHARAVASPAGAGGTAVAPAALVPPPADFLDDVTSYFSGENQIRLVQIAVIGGCIALYIMFRARGVR
jgi:hypothetical protein